MNGKPDQRETSVQHRQRQEEFKEAITATRKPKAVKSAVTWSGTPLAVVGRACRHDQWLGIVRSYVDSFHIENQCIYYIYTYFFGTDSWWDLLPIDIGSYLRLLVELKFPLELTFSELDFRIISYLSKLLGYPQSQQPHRKFYPIYSDICCMSVAYILISEWKTIPDYDFLHGDMFLMADFC